MRLKFWNVILFIGLSVVLILFVSVFSQLELPVSTGPYAVGRTVYSWMT